MEDCTIREAALQIQEWFGLETKPTSRRKPRKKQAVARKTESVQNVPGKPKTHRKFGHTLKLDDQHEWFDERKIDPAVVDEFGIGFCSKGVLQGCIAFPVHDEYFQLAGYVGYDLSKSEGKDESPWRIPKQLDVFAPYL